MATQEELYRKWGPKLDDAQMRLIRKEINIIRQELGLPTRTLQEMVDALDIEHNAIPDYSWMNNPLV